MVKPKSTKIAGYHQGAILCDEHLAELEASAISPKVIAARGYRCVSGELGRRELLDLGFKSYQIRAHGLLIPLYGILGGGEITGYLYKPKNPRKAKGKARKYEMPP